MGALLLAWFGKAKLYLIAAGVFIAAILAAYVKGEFAGSADAKAKAAEAARKSAQKARKVEHEVDSLSANDVSDRLKRRWMRD